MALDIEKLRLTLKETADSTIREGNEPGTAKDQQLIADAATAKALWGVLDWLYEEKARQLASHWADRESKAEILNLLALGLVEALHQAGIGRPEGVP